MDMIQLLCADVTQIPIITSPAQELWLGIQIKAPQAWATFYRHDDRALLTAIYGTLGIWLSKLEETTSESNIMLPQIHIWATEALEARQNIYALLHSRLRRFVRIVATQVDHRRIQLVDSAYNAAELLCLLPDPALGYIARAGQKAGTLPEQGEFQEWIRQHPCRFVWECIERRAYRARTLLTNGYLRYVLRIARGAMGQGVDYLDLVQEGALGLMHAVERFDYRVNTRFATFATSWIWQSIGRAIADQGRTIRLPVHMHERVQAFKRTVETMETADELVSMVDDSLSDVEEEAEPGAEENQEPLASANVKRKASRLLEFSQPLVQLDLELPDDVLRRAGVEDADSVTLADCIADQSGEMGNQQKEWRQTAEALIAATPGISARDLKVIHLRYGLDDGQERTLEETGQCFGLTRERIHQIERRALKRIKDASSGRQVLALFAEPTYCPLLPEAVQSYLEEHLDFRWPAFDLATEYERFLLDRYLEQLPSGDWHTGRAPGEDTRQQQLAAALRLLAVPAHYRDITEQVNELAGDAELDERYIYALLMGHEEIFMSLGEGIFSLVEWERKRAAEAEAVLPFCPAPLSDPPSQPNAFFESVMIACGMLQTPHSSTQFLRAMTKWAGLSWPQPRWFCQTILLAYYLVGVIPYVFYADDEERILSLTLPTGDLQSLREYCLETLSRRLQAMPEFWWLLQWHQPIRATDLAQLFVDVHPLGLDDVSNRLTLLAGLGAVQKSSHGRYRLTRLGEKATERWGRKPSVLDKTAIEILEEDALEFADLSFD